MILANGCPKSGTHALLALLENLGHQRTPGTVKPKNSLETLMFHRHQVVHTVMHAHLPFAPATARQIVADGHRIVTVIRDPRNVLVSYWRWTQGRLLLGNWVDPHEERTLGWAFENFLGEAFVARYRAFLAWRGRCTVVRYEDLVPGRRSSSPDDTATSQPSDWRQHWDSNIAGLWTANGGPELLKEAGYD